MNDVEQRVAAKAFAAYWKDKGYEKGESQSFWLSLLRDVILSILVDTFSSRILNPMLLPSGKRNIVVF